MTAITPSLVQEAIVEIMRSNLGRALPVDTTAAATLARRITPAAQRLGIDASTSSVLSANSAFHSLVAQHLGSPAETASTDPNFRQQLRDAIERANLHGPDYLAGVRDGMRLGRMLADVGQGSHSRQARPPSYEDLPSSANTTITTASLPPSLRGFVGEAYTAAHVAGTAQYLERIGIVPSAYTGHFLGTSETFRKALEQHVRHGAQLRGDQIDTPKALAATFAALESGQADTSKTDPKIVDAYERAKREGVDMRDATAIEKWQKDQPDLLKQLRSRNAALDTASGIRPTTTPEAGKAAVEQAGQTKTAAPPKATAATEAVTPKF